MRMSDWSSDVCSSELSVWPSLQFGTSNITTEGEPQIAFDLLNRGIGPARIRWAELTYDGTPVPGLRALLKNCCGHEGESYGRLAARRGGKECDRSGIYRWPPLPDNKNKTKTNK